MEINLYKIPSSSRVLLLSAIFSLTNALPHSGPDPTASYKPADWNPRPTSVPQSLPELLKRDNSDASICGWVGGNVNQPSACPSDSKCVYDTSHGMVGCCPLSGSCTTGVYASCVGSAQGPLNPSILTCSGGSVCYENTFPGGYYQYACGASTDGKTIATTYSGQNWAFQLQIIYTQLTLATTQSASNTALSTTTITQSPSPTSALSSTASSTIQTITSATSQTSASTGFPAGAQSATNTSTAAIAAAGPSPQGQAGIIAGSVVGGVGVIFAILALACSLMRRRQRQKAEERARTISFPSKEKTMSISSYASSQISSHTRIHPFSPDDIVSPMTPPEQAATAILQPLVLDVPQQAQPLVGPEDSYVRRVQLVDAPVVRPLVEKEEPYMKRVQLVDRTSIDDLADLPPPWVRPPTPPPRSPKRLTMRVHPPEDHTPLEVYLKSAITPIRPSVSVTSNTSDTSRYSRTTDGRSIKSIREGRNGASREGEAPPMPIMRKPVGSGWYRTMAPLAEKKPSSDHVAFQLSNVTDTGRSFTAPQQTRERSISVPARASVAEDVLDRYADMSATIYNVQELDFEGLESDWVAPLRLSSSLSQATTVKKQRNSQVPILGVPAAPPPGGRGSRLYDVQR